MKIKIDNKELINQLQIVQNTTPKRSSLPILSNYLLETDLETKKLWITSSDLELSVRSAINANIEQEGAITLPAKKFSEILHELPANGAVSEVVLELKENDRVQVLGFKSRFQIAGTPKDDYPDLPLFNKENAVCLPARVVSDMICKTVFAASLEETRYILNGVLFQLAGGKLTMVATDGRRLAAIYEEGLTGSGEFRTIVPARTLSEIARIIGCLESRSANLDVLVDISENKAGFRIEDTTIISRLIDGNFPGWEQVIPKKGGFVITVNKEAFFSVTKRASLCIADKVGTCRYRFSKSSCQVTSKTMGHYEFDEEIAISGFEAEEDLEISFNPHHIIDFLKSFSGDVFNVMVTTPVNPVLFTTPENPKYSYVVMPTRVQ